MNLNRKDEFFLYLSSGDINPYSLSNTTVKFRTALSTTLFLPREENWRVALSSISLSRNLGYGVEFFEVKTGIIQPKFNQTKTLAVLPANESDTDPSFNHQEITKKEFFPLGSSHISNIDIQITDLDGTELKPPYSQPTLITLHFKKMPQEEYIVRFDSRNDPNGSANEFFGQLPSSLLTNPNQKWEVSVNTLLYEGDFVQVPPFFGEEQKLKADYMCEVGNHENENAIPEEESTETEELEQDPNDMLLRPAPAPDASMTEVEADAEAPEEEEPQPTFILLQTQTELLGRKLLNNRAAFGKFQTAMSKLKYMEKTTDRGQEKKLFAYVRKHNDIIRFEVKRDCTLYIPYAWAVILGSTQTPDQEGYVRVKMKKNEIFQFEHKMDFKAWLPHYVLLYTDFIDYSPFGSFFVPILKTIPLEVSETGKYYRQFFEPKTDEYHPVTFSQLQNVKFYLRTIDGRPVEFYYPTARVVLSLKFRKR